MTVRSPTFMSALQVFRGIFVTPMVGFSLLTLHVFYITIVKIIYVYNNDAHSIYETYTVENGLPVPTVQKLLNKRPQPIDSTSKPTEKRQATIVKKKKEKEVYVSGS
jgi:hypothetical protein